MSEEEKKAIKYLEFLSNEKCECKVCQNAKKHYKIILKLIEKQQNEIASLKKQIKLMQNCDLEKVIEKQQEEIKKLEEQKRGLLVETYKANDNKDKEIEKEKLYTDFYKDLCDKQQKEIEDLYKYKADNDSYKVSEVNKYVNRILEGYVSKAKIREKIKELEKEKDMYFEKQIMQSHIDILEELLEE